MWELVFGSCGVCRSLCVGVAVFEGGVAWLVSVLGFVMCTDLNFINSQIGDPRILQLVLKDVHLCEPLPLSVLGVSLFRCRNAQTF